MSNYNYLFVSSVTYPAFYYLTIPTSTTIEPHLNQSQAPIQPVQIPSPPARKPVLKLTQQDLLQAGYEKTKRVWNSEEDQRLIQFIGKQNIPWRQIEQHMPGRTQKMCYSRYRRLMGQARMRWTPQDQQKLKDLVQDHGQRWKQFTSLFPNRTWKQLRDKYSNYLRPDINRDDWSLEQDLKILELMDMHGTKWKLIQSQMAGRTDNQIKNRYYGHLKILLKRKARRRT